MGGSDQWGNIVAGVDLIRKSTLKIKLMESHIPFLQLLVEKNLEKV